MTSRRLCRRRDRSPLGHVVVVHRTVGVPSLTGPLYGTCCYDRAVSFDFDADAVRGLGRDARRLADSLEIEAQGAEASLSNVSSSTSQDDVKSAVDDLLRTLKSAHVGVVHGLKGFGAELEMTAAAVEATDRELASRAPAN